jgi:integrase
MTLTDLTIKALKPAARRREVYDDHVPGLSLRVTPTGIKSWSLRYRVGGQQMPRLTLGRYPAVTLEKARKQALRAMGRVSDGENPAADKRAARLGETIGDLAKAYIAKHAKRKKRSWADDQRYLDKEVLPRWKTLKVKDLTRRHVRELIDGIADRGAPISANRCLAVVRKMLNFAVSQDWLDANPAALLPKPGAERSRDRVLTDAEIRLVWAACEAERPTMAALMKLRLLTAQRGGELSALKWTDIDGPWLTIPATATKNKRAHRVYLTPTAKALIDDLPHIEECDYVFPGRAGNTHCSDHKKAGQRIAAHVLATLQQDDATIERFDFRGHDLRRTASTKMAEAGISQADIAKVLNHAEGGPKATHVYNRYAYDREKLIALETWDRVLTRILTDTPTADVVPITKRA